MSSSRQTKSDREYILQNLPEEAIRIQIVNSQGRQEWKRPEEVDLDLDEIVLNSSGSPVIMRGKPGRKPKARLKPLTPQLEELAVARMDHVETDSIVRDARRDPSSDSVLDNVIKAMAEEAATLEFERLESERLGVDPTINSLKRARVLKSMADTLIKRKSVLQGGLIDMDSPVFQALFGAILETFKLAMGHAGCRKEQIEITFSSLVRELESDLWKEEAKRRMRDKAV